jgi:hypothetical protein
VRIGFAAARVGVSTAAGIGVSMTGAGEGVTLAGAVERF